MKVLKKILLVCLIMILAMNIKVRADETTVSNNDVTLKLSSTEAKIGDKIQLIISAKSDTGIGGLDSILTWDKTKLKFVNENSFPLSGTNDSTGEFSFSVLYDGDDTEADLATLEFEVIDTVTAGEVLNIGFSNIEIIDTNDDGIKISDKQVAITIIGEGGNGEDNGEGDDESDVEGDNIALTEIKITQEPTKTTYKVGEKFDKTGMIITATYSDGTTKEVSNYTYSPDIELTLENKEIIITYTEGEVTKTVNQKITVEEVKEPADEDPTTADKNINNAGIDKRSIVLIVFVLLVAIVLYTKCKKYSDIK